MVTRLMLNLQNPALFSPSLRNDTNSTRTRTRGTGTTTTQLGPFVTTIVCRGTSAGSVVTGPEFSIGTRPRSDAEAYTDAEDGADGLGGYSNEWDCEEYKEYGYGSRRRALWYDREWVTGTRPAEPENVAKGRPPDAAGGTDIGMLYNAEHFQC